MSEVFIWCRPIVSIQELSYDVGQTTMKTKAFLGELFQVRVEHLSKLVISKLCHS